jgi:hypothetical protein
MLTHLRRQFARLVEFAVNPLLNSVGHHAHQVRVRPAGRDRFADLELPFPQARFHLREGELHAPCGSTEVLQFTSQPCCKMRHRVPLDRQICPVLF